MGKKKKGGGAEKTAEKTAKKDKKKLLKENQEDDIENIIKNIKKEEEKRLVSSIDLIPSAWKNPSFPPRCNMTMLPFHHPSSPHSSLSTIIMFGGEYNDGRNTTVFGDLLLFNWVKNDLRQWLLPHPPPPRSSHCMVMSDGPMSEYYIFGGEYQSKSGEQFHHFKDLWRLSVGEGEGEIGTNTNGKTNSTSSASASSTSPPSSLSPSPSSSSSSSWHWTELKVKFGPSPRSGSRMIFYKKKLFCFGGFHDNGKRTDFYNDLFIFDILNNEWKECKQSTEAAASSSSWPSPRSGHCFWLDEVNGTAYLYGGTGITVSPNKNNPKKFLLGDITPTIYSDLWALDLANTTWTLVKKRGIFPAKRAGMSVVGIPTKQKSFLFGGVIDEDNEEKEKEKGNTKDKEKDKGGKKGKEKEKRRHHDEDDEDDGDDSLSHSIYLNDLFLFNSANATPTQPSCHYVDMKGDGLVSKTETFLVKSAQMKKSKGKDEDNPSDQQEEEGEGGNSIFDFDPTKGVGGEEKGNPNEKQSSDMPSPSPSLSSPISTSSSPLSRLPHPRLSPSIAFIPPNIILYGGVVESSSDRQYVLDDWWTIDITKGSQYEWKCLSEIKEETLIQLQREMEGAKGIDSEDEEEEEGEEEAEDEKDDEDEDEDGDDKNEEDPQSNSNEKSQRDEKNSSDVFSIQLGESVADYFNRNKTYFLSEAKIHIENHHREESNKPIELNEEYDEEGKVIGTSSAPRPIFSPPTEKEIRKVGFELASDEYSKRKK